MKLNNRFIFGILSLLLAAVIAFVALPTIARQTNGKEEIVRITQPVLKGEQISSENAEVVEVGGYNLPSNIAHLLSDVNGLYATADLAVGDYILTSKISSVPVSSDVALNSIPSGKVAISLTVKTLASGLSDKLQPGDIIRIYHFLDTAAEVPEGKEGFLCISPIPLNNIKSIAFWRKTLRWSISCSPLCHASD